MIIESMALTVAIAAFVGAYKGLNKFNPDNINVMRGLPVTKPDYKALRVQEDARYAKGIKYNTNKLEHLTFYK